jgi:hypothetical protein
MPPPLLPAMLRRDLFRMLRNQRFPIPATRLPDYSDHSAALPTAAGMAAHTFYIGPRATPLEHLAISCRAHKLGAMP